MNNEYVWWFLALLLAGGGMVVFLALGRVPEIEDGPAEEPGGRDQDPDRAALEDAAEDTAAGGAYSAPLSTTVPGPGAPASTSDTP